MGAHLEDDVVGAVLKFVVDVDARRTRITRSRSPPTWSLGTSTRRRSNQVRAADITYVWAWAGWLYLAVVVDLFSRRVVGWALADHMRTELVLSALAMAVEGRRPADGLVHHSDRGSQRASNAYLRIPAPSGWRARWLSGARGGRVRPRTRSCYGASSTFPQGPPGGQVLANACPAVSAVTTGMAKDSMCAATSWRSGTSPRILPFRR